MSLWCSLLGHRFGERTVEREREERDEEVLTITRELETCARCGTGRVVSENTEIATVEPSPTHLTDEAPPDSDGPAEPVPPRDPADEDAEILDTPDAGRAPGEWPAEPGEDDAEGSDGTADVPSGQPSASVGDADTQPRSVRCSECGFETRTAGSSLREGDSCPECRIGYLEST